MKPINKLEGILAHYFCWDKRRIACFSQMLLSIMVVQTTNLTKIANQLSSTTNISNRYRRLQRFFESCRINYDDVARFIFQLFFSDTQKIYLTMDRTNWQWGKRHINILLLGIVYKGTAIPIYWIILKNKKGNSSTRQRIALIQRFINIFGKECIAGLLADREFIGKKWFEWLDAKKIGFFIRIKNDALTNNSRGKEVEAAWLFYDLRALEKKIIVTPRKIYGCNLFLTGARSPNGDLVLIASNLQKADAIEKYFLRWEIEVLFQSLKSRGFNFEDTHMTNRRKIKKLIVLLAVGFCWSHKVGEWRCKNEREIKFKKHGRKAISIFRYGLDLIHGAIAQLIKSISPIMRLIEILRPPDCKICGRKHQRLSTNGEF